MHAKPNCIDAQQGMCGVVSYDGMRRVALPAAPCPQPARRSQAQAVTNVAEISRIERVAADPATVQTTNRPKASAWLPRSDGTLAQRPEAKIGQCARLLR